MLRKHGVKSLPDRVETTTIQQDKSIDVLARVDPDYVLLIEDKTGTKDHGGQLKRYYKAVIEGRTKLKSVNPENVYPIYLKTGNQSRAKDRQVEVAIEGFPRCYRVFNRSEFLAVLATYRGDHRALLDYRDHLERKENKTRSFRVWQEDTFNEWSWESWEGFFRYLEDGYKFDLDTWGYVSNRSGGFLCFEWNTIYVNGSGGPKLCLRLEVTPGKNLGKNQDRNRCLLCFKVHDVVKAKQGEWKKHWHKRIMAAGKGKVKRPRMMRVGNTMTVGHWSGKWLAFNNGKIDIDGTVANLRAAENILRSAAEST